MEGVVDKIMASKRCPRLNAQNLWIHYTPWQREMTVLSSHFTTRRLSWAIWMGSVYSQAALNVGERGRRVRVTRCEITGHAGLGEGRGHGAQNARGLWKLEQARKQVLP